jgi:hypothetical protein
MLPGSEQPNWPALHDLAFLLAAEAAALAGRLSSSTAIAVGDLVRGMNCYYSNLIEGHDTLPVDIERPMRSDLATEPHRRDLQIEAAAHIAVQAAIDGGALDEFAPPSTLAVEIHRQFYERLPASLRFVEEHETGRRIEVRPGELRTDHARLAPLLKRAILFGEMPRAEVPSLVGTSDRQARRLVRPLIARGLLTGAKDAPLRIAFLLGETERLFPYLWAPSSVARAVASLPEIEEALRLPQRQ